MPNIQIGALPTGTVQETDRVAFQDVAGPTTLKTTVGDILDLGRGVGGALAFSCGERTVDGTGSQFDAATIELDPSRWGPSAAFHFEGILSVDTGGRTAFLELLNLDAAEDVVASLSTGSLSPVSVKSGALTQGVGVGELRPTATRYAVRLRIDGGAAPTDLALLGSAQVRVL